MKRKSIFNFLSTVWFLLFLFSSCNDINLSDISSDIKIDESLVIPIGEGNIKIEDILTQMNQQDLITTVGDTIYFQSEIDKEYKFGDINILKSPISINPAFSLTAVPRVPANTVIPTSGTNLNLDMGLDPASTTKRIDSTKISSATFGVNVSINDIKLFGTNTLISESDLKITLVFPKMHKPNSKIPISQDVTINKFGGITNVVLSDFIMDTNGLTGVPLQVVFKSGNRDITLGASAAINLGFTFNQLVYEVAYGKFAISSLGTTTIKIPLDILSSLPKGLKFANPKAIISVQSNIGSYLQFNIDEVKAFSKDYSTSVQALFNGNKSTVEYLQNKPTVPNEFVTNFLKTLDKNYGTTDKLFDTTQKFDTLVYKFSLIPDDVRNSTSTTPSFIVPGLLMKAHVKVQVPLYLKEGSTITIADTIQNIGSIMSNLNQGILMLNVTNSLPVKVTLKIRFLDQNNDSIISSINNSRFVINSGIVNTNANSASFGVVTAPTITPLKIELTKEQTVQLKNAKSMEFTIIASGQDDTKAIQFTKNDYIKLKLGVFVNGSLSTNGLTNN